MTQLIPWFFNLLVQVWQLITQYWILSIFALIAILDFIVSLVINSSQN